MRGNIVERFFHRDYGEQEDDCTFTRHTVWTPSLTGGNNGRLVEDASPAGDDVAHEEITSSACLRGFRIEPGFQSVRVGESAYLPPHPPPSTFTITATTPAAHPADVGLGPLRGRAPGSPRRQRAPHRGTAPLASSGIVRAVDKHTAEKRDRRTRKARLRQVKHVP